MAALYVLCALFGTVGGKFTFIYENALNIRAHLLLQATLTLKIYVHIHIYIKLYTFYNYMCVYICVLFKSLRVFYLRRF